MGQVSSSTVRVVIGAPPPEELVDVVVVAEPELVSVDNDEVEVVDTEDVEVVVELELLENK